MTLVEIADSLPWGLHDAYLEKLELDWLAARLTVTVRLMMTEHQDMDQRARITIDGLVHCSIEAPEIDPARGYRPMPDGGLRISDGPGVAGAGAMTMPATPEGCFLHWFYVDGWNRFIHICGREARLDWLEPSPVPSRAATRALFPGEEIPDPKAP